MHIVHAQPGDIPAWLQLAAEVEDLFGPLVAEPGFHQALRRNIARQTALSIRESNGCAGSPLLGGLLFSARHAPRYRIGWLAVAATQRRRGLGQALVGHMLAAITPPAELEVVTFGADVADGLPARRFYQRLGFAAAEAAPPGPEGGSRQVFRRAL